MPYSCFIKLKGVKKKSCPWNVNATEAAATYGNLECLKYLHENGCPWNDNATNCATLIGQLTCMKYLHENGCPWHSSVPIKWKVKVWWAMFREMVKARPIALHLQEMAAIRTHSETGKNRKRDREDFESVFVC